jgi:hypothetical protein
LCVGARLITENDFLSAFSEKAPLGAHINGVNGLLPRNDVQPGGRLNTEMKAGLTVRGRNVETRVVSDIG